MPGSLGLLPLSTCVVLEILLWLDVPSCYDLPDCLRQFPKTSALDLRKADCRIGEERTIARVLDRVLSRYPRG
jgi:hypothetical protein